MAKSLVENLSATFEPAKYDDTYRKELLGVVAREGGRQAAAGAGGRRRAVRSST